MNVVISIGVMDKTALFVFALAICFGKKQLCHLYRVFFSMIANTQIYAIIPCIQIKTTIENH